MKNKNKKFMRFIDQATDKMVKTLIITLPLAGSIALIDWNAQKVLAEIDNTSPVIELYEEVPEVVVPEPELTIQEHVWNILEDEGGLTFSEIVSFMSIVQCESSWDPYAINKNKDGSFDTGLFQINNRIHGKHISRKDTFDVYASTRYALSLYEKHGFQPWVCSW